MQVDYLDTPGVGDMDVTPMKVLTLIEQELLGTHLAIFNLFACFPIFFPPKRQTRFGGHTVACVSLIPQAGLLAGVLCKGKRSGRRPGLGAVSVSVGLFWYTKEITVCALSVVSFFLSQFGVYVRAVYFFGLVFFF